MNFYTKIQQSSSDPLIMGILNLTPDSFYDGGRYTKFDQISSRVQTMINEGVDIIDLGAFSSRPGAQLISLKEEENRLFPALIKIRELFPKVTLSIDTYRYQIAEQAIKYGANMINNIYIKKYPKKMAKIVQKYNTPYIIMHMRGEPRNMQNQIQYNNFKNEICMFFKNCIKELNEINFDKIIIDPGFGFGKTLLQNYNLINMIPELKKMSYPVLVGLSRKSMIFKALNQGPDDCLHGTIAANTIALTKGANILRVHDIKEAIQTKKIVQLVQQNNLEN